MTMPKFSQGTTERIEFDDETITLWRTFNDPGRGRPQRRWHFDISGRFFSEPPGFMSREDALSRAKWFIIWRRWEAELSSDLAGEPSDQTAAAARDEKAARLRERLELVTIENGYAVTEVEMAKRKLAEMDVEDGPSSQAGT